VAPPDTAVPPSFVDTGLHRAIGDVCGARTRRGHE
jgi:hypothetical protein